MAHPLTKEEIEKAKTEQKAIIAEADRQITNYQFNIGVLNSYIAQKDALKVQAQAILADLDDDFPVVASVTTASGNPEAKSIIDSSLTGSIIALVGRTLKVRPAEPEEDSAVIIDFKKDTGEVLVGKPLKGGQVPKGVSYKVLEAIPGEVV